MNPAFIKSNNELVVVKHTSWLVLYDVETSKSEEIGPSSGYF